MTRLRWVLLLVVAGAAWVLYDVYLLVDHLADVQGNLEASVIWGTPAGLLLLWHTERRHREREKLAADRHRELTERLDAQDAAIGATGGKVGELHDWHLRGVLPPDTLQP